MIKQSVNDFKKLWEISDINQIWEIEDKNNLVLALYGYLSNKCSYGEKIQELSNEEATIYLCQVFEGEINNGGFSQFFYNLSGDFSIETLQALKTIGANNTALIYKMALSIFPKSNAPKDRDEREKLLDSLNDEKTDKILNDADNDFYKYEDDLLGLSYAYIITNKESFK